jgi:hypothetical protein
MMNQAGGAKMSGSLKFEDDGIEFQAGVAGVAARLD